MMFRTPRFWYDASTAQAKLRAALLLPFSLPYLAVFYMRRVFTRPYNAGIPVICIGNLVAGGSGKTPAALALAEILRTHWPLQIPCFLTRGYGGSLPHPEVVSPRHQPAQAGDEALLLSRVLNTVVARNRVAGAKLAVQKGFDVIVMDDGLQNPTLKKDISFIVIDGAAGLGNNLPLPAGPLREPAFTGLGQADAIILIGEDRTDILKKIPADIPLFFARMETHNRHMLSRGMKYIAFCGLGRPEKFLETLKAERVDVAEFHPFPDHHPYTAQDMQTLAARAKQLGARLITTEKDAVRLPPGFRMGENIDVLPVRLRWEHPAEIIEFLSRKLPKGRA